MKLSIPVLSVLLLATNAQSYTELKPNFVDKIGSKNFAFVGLMGGSSHFNWVLSIGNQLCERGHNFTFIASTQDERFAKPYTDVKFASYGPRASYDKSQAARYFEIRRENPTAFIVSFFDIMYKYLERDYAFTRQYFIDNHIDVAVCDHFADICVDAATSLNIPYIVTGSADMTEESSAPYVTSNPMSSTHPTTEFQSISTRFYEAFIEPFITIYNFYPSSKKIIQRKRAIGIPAKFGKPGAEWKYSLKLVNNLNGYTAARPVGALSEYIGPVLATKYAPLTKELETYLENHQKVAYIAFGEKATPNTRQIVLMLRPLLESMESGRLDGFIWAVGDATGEFPETVTTSSNTTYNIRDILSNGGVHSDIRLMKYAPQTAILSHPSAKLFISHGGLTSWYESMYAGVPMVMFPFFGDQFSNSFIITNSHLGGLLDDGYTINQAVEVFKNVLDDKDGKIKESVQRYQAMTQIHSRRGVERGADLIEEVAYTHVNGRLPHRESADKRMSYIKAHNIDIYALLVLLIISVISGVSSLYLTLKKRNSIKVKKL